MIEVLYIISNSMELAHDMTENEIRQNLLDIWAKYIPQESSDFINQLDWEQLGMLLELLVTKNPVEQEGKRSQIEKRVTELQKNVWGIMQKAKLLTIQIHEKISNTQNSDDIENLLATM